MKYQAIVLAAGNSSRSGLDYNKVLFSVNGKKIIEISLHNFLLDVECEKIFLVCRECDLKDLQKVVLADERIQYVIGGETRQDSVKNALQYVTSEYVFIHDGARPFYTSILLNRLKAKLKDEDAVIPVWSLRDTIKVVRNNYVVKTLKRDELRSVQTPQAFKTTVILKAHELAKRNDYTDDSSMVEELLSLPVATIDGEYSNRKYTYREDF